MEIHYDMESTIRFLVMSLNIVLITACGGSNSSPEISKPNNHPPLLLPPSNVTSYVYSNSTIKISWSNVAEASYYIIFKGIINDPEQSDKLKEPLSNMERTHKDKGLDTNIDFFYWVKSCNEYGCSKYSIVATNKIEPVTEMELNDTGVSWGGDYSYSDNVSCMSNIDFNQDCHQGRDSTHNDDSDGNAGFSFTKLDSDGSPLPNTATSWSCVKDNITKLIWEVKTNDSGLHDMNDEYLWYNSNTNTNYGNFGRIGDENKCYEYDRDNESSFCNTEFFVARVNESNFCGASDWYLPSVEELRSISDYSRISPAIDTNYFPNTLPYGSFYTSTRMNSLYTTITSSRGTTGGNIGWMSVRLVRLSTGS